MMNLNLLLICGPSGSGKTSLETNLINDFALFNKLPQVTTREMREKESFGNPYIFIKETTYKQMENFLIARINEPSKFKSFYGTFPDFDYNKINTIIASEEGIRDLIRNVDNIESTFNVKLNHFVLGLNPSYTPSQLEKIMKDHKRSYETIAKEKEVLELAHYVIKFEGENYPNHMVRLKLLNQLKLAFNL